MAGKLLKYLPNPMSCSMSNRNKPAMISGQLVPKVPKDKKKTKKKKGGSDERGRDPTSPRVSCMGQVKHEKGDKGSDSSKKKEKKKMKKPLRIQSMFERKEKSLAVTEIRMRRCESGREKKLGGFDWSKEEEEEGQVVVVVAAVAAEKKKEVNLWKRRPVVPPLPLQVK